MDTHCETLNLSPRRRDGRAENSPNFPVEAELALACAVRGGSCQREALISACATIRLSLRGCRTALEGAARFDWEVLTPDPDVCC